MHEKENFLPWNNMIHMIESPAGQLLLGGIITLAGKWAWDRWLSKKSRMSLDDCERIRSACISNRNLNLSKLLGIQDSRLRTGDENFECFGTKLERMRTVLEAVLEIQLKMCKVNPEIDCEDLIRTLARKGLDLTETRVRHNDK